MLGVFDPHLRVDFDYLQAFQHTIKLAVKHATLQTTVDSTEKTQEVCFGLSKIHVHSKMIISMAISIGRW